MAAPRPADDRRMMSRRTVAKTAAHAAWAAPVIAVATAAPAYAVSNLPIALSGQIYNSGGGIDRVNVNVQIAKQYGSVAIASATIQVKLTPTDLGALGKVVMGTDVVNTNTAQFAVAGTPSVSGGVLTVNFTTVGNPFLVVEAYSQKLLTFNVGLTNANNLFPRGTMTASVVPSAGTAPTILPTGY